MTASPVCARSVRQLTPSRLRFALRACALLFCMCAAAPAFAQGRATVFGQVQDQTGAAVPGAAVTLTNTDTQAVVATKTGGEGNYNLSSVVPGRYRVNISAAGFSSFVVNSVSLQVDENREVDARLQIGGTTEQVVVNDSTAAQVDTRSATITEVIDAERVKELPLNGRNPLQLQYLVAGAGQVSAGGGGQAQSDVVSINGGRPNSNNYTLDGADNEDPFFNAPAYIPNPDALDQFSLKTSNYGAGEGRGSGAQMNAITKSGTNKFHGTLFEYLRNSAMDAFSYFTSKGTTPVKPPFRRNQFGGTIGGPILKDKLFFFFAYQGTRQNSSPSTANITVLSAAERAGNFAELCSVFNAAGTCTTGTQLFVPGASARSTTPIPNNNLVAAGLYSAPSRKFLDAFVPLPNSSNNQYSYNPVSKLNEDQYTGKLDTVLTTKDTLSGRIVYVNNQVVQVASTTNLPGFLAGINYETWNVAVNETHSFSPRLLNLFTFGYNNIVRHQLPIVPKQLTWADFGSGIVRADPTAPIGWDTTVTGNFGSLSRWPLNQLRSGLQFSDSVNWTLGNHSLVIGTDLRQQFTDQSQTFQTDSALTFSGSYTGNALADLVSGRMSRITQQAPNGGKPAAFQPDAYAQDDWKLSQRLTLNLGLRWEPFVPLHDRTNRVAQYRAGQQSTTLPKAPLGYVFPGDAGVPSNTYPARWGVFSPRIGFAFDVFGDGKTALRGAIGIYNGNVRSQALNGLSSNLPFSYALSIANPTGGLANPYSDVGGSPFPFSAPTPAQYASYTFPSPLAAVTMFDPRFRNSRVDQWNLNLQQQLPGKALLTLAYVGSSGEHLLGQMELNAAVATKTGATTQARRVDPNFTSINNIFSGGHSSYHALQTTFNKRLDHGVTVLSSYTWARSLDNTSDDLGNFFNPFNLRAARGLSDFDVRHNFVTSFIWRLPEPAGNSFLLKAVAKGWELNGIVNLQAGSPFSVLSGVDNSRSGVGVDRADRIGFIQTYANQGHAAEVARFFNTASYTVNALNTFGNSGRNNIIGPGYQNVDFGFTKALPSPEYMRLIFRAEAFNLLNHANFGNPNANVSSGTNFGRITALRYNANPRDLQVALRVEF